MSAIISVIIPMVDAFITRTVADSIIEKTDVDVFVRTLLILFGAFIILKILSVWAEERIWFFQNKVSMLYGIDLMHSVMDKDLIDFETTGGRALFERAKSFAFDGEQADGAWSAIRFSKLVTSFVGFLTYTVLFSKVSYALILIIISTSCIAYYLQDRLIRFGDKTADEMSGEEMRLYYLYRVASDSRAQREVRLGRAFEWIYDYLHAFSEKYYSILRRYTNRAGISTGLEAILGFIRDIATYYILVKSVILREMTIGDFIFYLTLVVGFSEWLNRFTGHISSLKRISISCGKYREFIMDDKIKEKKPEVEWIETIEFKDVSFSYQNGVRILKNINLKLKRGESVAIVGENGAGKTTLIKVLSGLYSPTAGNIFINGKHMDTFSLPSIYERISVLFQDYFLLPGTLLDNVDNHTRDKNRAKELMESLGLKSRLDGLKDGIESDLTDLENNRLEGFSGGELQKILLVKSLMKNSDVLILDEPTAALDPISEEKLYKEYQRFSKGKISIFISHRITSTRFCDRIIYLEDGQIKEYGTYEELMNLNGKYRKMFDLQGKYYKEQNREEY
ncbi:MAG: ABC transporter ATP-binding protein [Tissierellia bacterium]|nr:ABC transporter ATP-binding protein [Tissierellia bacterium]